MRPKKWCSLYQEVLYEWQVWNEYGECWQTWRQKWCCGLGRTKLDVSIRLLWYCCFGINLKIGFCDAMRLRILPSSSHILEGSLSFASRSVHCILRLKPTLTSRYYIASITAYNRCSEISSCWLNCQGNSKTNFILIEETVRDRVYSKRFGMIEQ